LPASSDHPLRLASFESADADALSALHARCFENGWSSLDFCRMALEDRCCGVVARHGTVVAGFALAQVASEEAEILTIAVAPELRGRGVGAALLDRLERDLAARGAGVVFLEVSTENAAAIALYRKTGFTQAGRRPGYYQTRDGKRDALLLRRTLGEPVV
jgi:ribosomal-protein-alanine N-acetyltransferase